MARPEQGALGTQTMGTPPGGSDPGKRPAGREPWLECGYTNTREPDESVIQAHHPLTPGTITLCCLHPLLAFSDHTHIQWHFPNIYTQTNK